MTKRFVFVSLALLASPAMGQDYAAPFDFSMQATDTCLARAGDSGADPAACFTKAAENCMEINEGGFSNVGAGRCYRLELKAWDRRLNDAYQVLLEDAARRDADMDSYGTQAPRQVPALRQTQRAWIAYRDAKCDYVYSLWEGGTGGGPASSECLLRETAHQALALQDFLQE